ncbi:DUF7668 domain-containing protein [Actinokineospora xionganensis]|uniref:DUF7668 domain-containing protein n=1 Tax=Actinokineospora xionganensis TaxID=2684470 RepID=A0ABR7KZY6_9PSEU|nr:hypothetical protein [Actinokineospora xionganensis]MBC6445671.1 hypothetical protein [Actinokineospora xionganensis]
MVPAEAVQALRIAVGLLVEPSHDTLERMTQGKRLTAEMMTTALRDYGRTFVRPPAAAYADLDAYEGTRDGKRVYKVDFPLWTAEEGRSDLELRATLVEVMSGVYGVEIDDILVA